MAKRLIQLFVLIIFWLLLSGKFTPFHISVGLICCLIVVLQAAQAPTRSMNFSELIGISYRLLRYAAWLLTRIFLAAWHVTQVILKPKIVIDPRLIKHKTPLKNDTERVIFANSITLTPGTVTADIDGENLLVHALDEDSAGDIVTGLMESEIAKIFPKK